MTTKTAKKANPGPASPAPNPITEGIRSLAAAIEKVGGAEGGQNKEFAMIGVIGAFGAVVAGLIEPGATVEDGAFDSFSPEIRKALLTIGLTAVIDGMVDAVEKAGGGR